MNPEDATETKKAIAAIEQNAELASTFLATDFGKTYVQALDDLIDEYVTGGDNLVSDNALRYHDAAKGARAAKELLYAPIKALEKGGYVEGLRDMLRSASDQ